MTARLLILSLFFFSSYSLAHAEAVSGHVKSVLGEATLVTPGGVAKEIEIGTRVEPGSRIQTAADGRVVIEWMPGAYSVITPNSDIDVSSLHYSETANGTPHRRILLDLLFGSVFCHLKHNDGPSSFAISTPDGVAAARGTDFVVKRHGHTTEVATFTSAITFTLPSGKVIGVQAGVAYTVGVTDSYPMNHDQVLGFVKDLEDAGLIVLKSNNGGYTVIFNPPGGGVGFTFTIEPTDDLSENETRNVRDESDHGSLGELPIPSTNFTSP